MYVVESQGGAIACLLLALLFLGTWPAVMTLLERRGRLPQHTYLDYSITNLLASVVIALTFVEIGQSTHKAPNFSTQLSQLNDNWPSVMFATAVEWSSASEIYLPNTTSMSREASRNRERNNLENGDVTAEKGKFGIADFLVELENRRAIKVFGKSTLIGLVITFFSGVCFSLFAPAFDLASNDQWHTLKKGVPKLAVYTSFFWFSVSCFVMAIIQNNIFLYRPLLNLPRSSLEAYLNEWNGRGWALSAGLLCGFGNGLHFMGGQAAGYAAANAVEAFPLVSTFWGIALFGENRRSSQRTYILLVSMLSLFIAAVAVLMASSGNRM